MAAPRSPEPPAARPAAQPSGVAAAVRSNVVPFGGRHGAATAEKLEEAPIRAPAQSEERQAIMSLAPSPSPAPSPAAPVPIVATVSDPFASPPAATAPLAGVAGAMPGSPFAPTPLIAPAVAAPEAYAAPATRKSPPWIAIAMLVLAAAFGITAAIVIFSRGDQQPVVIQVDGKGTGTTSAAAARPTAPRVAELAPTDTTAPEPSTAPPPASVAAVTSARVPVVGTIKGAATSSGAVAAATTSSALSPNAAAEELLKGLGGTRHDFTPEKADTSSGAAAGSCYTASQVQSAVAQHQTAIRRVCWDNANTHRNAANISVTLTLGPNGNVQSASVGGDDPVVAACVRSDVSRWMFAPGGCSQSVGFSFKFVR